MKREILKKVLLSAIVFVSYYVGVSTYILSLSKILSTQGPGLIPPLFVASSILFLIFAVLNLLFSNRLPVEKVLIFLMLFYIGVYLVGGWFGLNEFWGMITLYISGFLFMIVFVFIYNEVVSALVTPIQAKGIFPLTVGFASLGIIAASLLIEVYEFYGYQIGVGFLSALIMSISLILTIILILFFNKTFKTNFSYEKSDRSSISEIKNAANYIFKETRLFKLLIWVIFMLIGLKILTEFKYNVVIEDIFAGQELSLYLGWVLSVINVILVILNFFIIKRVLFRFGVSNMLIFYPSLFLLLLFPVIFTGFDYRIVTILYVLEVVAYASIVNVTIHQIIEISDSHLHRMVYLFLKGLVVGVAMLFFSLLLLVFTYRIELEPFLNTTFLIVLATFLIVNLVRLKKMYLSELHSKLFSKNRLLRLKAIELLAEKSNKDKAENYLRRLLKMPELDYELKNKVIYSIGVIGNYQSLNDLIQVLKVGKSKEKFSAIQAINAIIENKKYLAKYPVSKHLLLEVYEELLLSDAPRYLKLEVISSLQYFNWDEIIYFLENHLKDDDSHIRTNIIEIFGTFKDRGIISYLMPYLKDEDVYVTAYVILSLWQFKDQRVFLLPKFSEILLKNDKKSKMACLLLIGSLNAVWEKKFVIKCLNSKIKKVKYLAIITMVKLGNMKYVTDFVEYLVKEVRAKGKSELDFLLSNYRKLPEMTKEIIIRKIQDLPEEDMQKIFVGFRDSDYLFGYEQQVLS
ncbi:hypothetical protein GF376_02715 [Candidatus Peregrinibacteria bacterium]|nr:hypothetical protein [Candidatus Peregrinibacteria bacterium]